MAGKKRKGNGVLKAAREKSPKTGGRKRWKCGRAVALSRWWATTPGGRISDSYVRAHNSSKITAMNSNKNNVMVGVTTALVKKLQ